MVNRKSLGLAAAIILLVAAGVVGDGGEEIFEYSARIVGELTDINGQPIDVALLRGRADPAYEEIVEGHIVFHTMDIIPDPPRDLKEINVEGLVECRYEVFGIGIPSGSIERVFVECNAGGRIFTSDPTRSQPASRADLVPTGWESFARRPDTGAPVLTTEYWYWATDTDDPGKTERVKAYCWETQTLDRGTNPHTGKDFNFVTSLNVDRLRSLDVGNLRVSLGENFLTFQ